MNDSPNDVLEVWADDLLEVVDGEVEAAELFVTRVVVEAVAMTDDVDDPVDVDD